MEVKTAIEYLQRMNPEDEIIIAWWVKEDFFDHEPTLRMEISKKEWEDIVHIGDDMDWSLTHESLKEVLEMEVEANRAANAG